MVRSAAVGLLPVWAFLRLDLRCRWRSLAVLSLLVALSCGVVMAATAGARRGGSAVDRLRDSNLAATVLVAPRTPGFDWDRVRRLPGVEAAGTMLLTVDFHLNIEGVGTLDGEDYWYPVGDAELTRTVERAVVLAGRLADPTQVGEAMVTESFAERHHVGVGDTVTARLFTPGETDAFLSGNVLHAASGPRQPLRIVGVVRSPAMNNFTHHSVIMTTVAFTDAYRANLLGASGHRVDFAAVRLTHGEAGLRDFQRRLAQLTGQDDIQFQNLAEEAHDAKGITGFERNALLMFALTALVASAVVLGQAAARYATAAAAQLRVLLALGMTRGQATAAAAGGPALAATVGAVVASAAAVAASGAFPIGTAADYEPAPGRHADLAVLAGTAVMAVALVTAAAALGAWSAFVRKRVAAAPPRSVVVDAAYRLGLPVPVLIGAQFALEPGRGRAAAPVRSALIGAVLGVLGVLAALTFHTGVADAAGNPQRFGHTYQIEGWIGFNGTDFAPARQVLDAFAADPDVVAVNDTRVGVATVSGLPVHVFTHQPAVAGRPLPAVTLSGRMPVAPDEIALAPQTVRETGAKVGDTLTFAGTARAPMRLTGVALVPEGGVSYAKGAWTTGDGYRALFPGGSFTYHQIHASLRSGANAKVVSQRISAVLGGKNAAKFGPAGLPREAQQLRNVRGLPLALGVFLALLAVATTGHTLTAAVRRRRHEVAVLRALGLTRRQSRLIPLAQAITLTLTGLLFGVPLGLALGWTMWRVVASSIPVLYVRPVAQLALALVVPATLLIGSLLAALPARRAARISVGEALRAE
ncbi:putative ABC transport system permease protein [Frankia sp. Hr75.2]|nr:putative ABC transport system permease protein [Frankia sp. Hr75.2]